MSDEMSRREEALPAPVALLQMMTGYWVSQAIYVAAKLGLADLLADGPKSAEELAAATGSHAPSLYRVFRALASIGIFTEASPGRFGLTPLAALLQTGRPGSMRALAIMYAEEQFHAWGNVLESVQTGEAAFNRLYGMDYFAYLAQHPESNQVFNEAMVGWTSQLVGAVVDTYDFSPFGTVVDVGGGYGALLAAILQKNPTQRGILFDQPHVIVDAEQHLRTARVVDRCTCIAGSFFEAVPPGGDAYVLAQILHDWDDEDCVTILKQCRTVMPEHGRLLIVELVLPPGDQPFFGKWLDLHMLTLLNARERTEAEYGALCHEAGFTLTRVVPTLPGPSVVEAVPA